MCSFVVEAVVWFRDIGTNDLRRESEGGRGDTRGEDSDSESEESESAKRRLPVGAEEEGGGDEGFAVDGDVEVDCDGDDDINWGVVDGREFRIPSTVQGK